MMHDDMQYPHLRFTLTLEDYRQFYFYHNRTLAVMWLIIYFVLFVGTAFIAGADHMQSFAVVLQGVLVCAAIGAGMWLFHRWWTHWVYGRNPLIRQEQSIECGPNGLRVITASSNLAVGWKEVSGVIETPHQFTIYTSGHKGFVIPKALIDSGTVRRMLRQHILPGRRIKLMK